MGTGVPTTATYIILVAKHALAVRNGVLIDNVNHDDDLLLRNAEDLEHPWFKQIKKVDDQIFFVSKL